MHIRRGREPYEVEPVPRGPYVVGQSVYVFRKISRGLLSTRHGTWLGPGRVVGTESYRDNSPVPRVIWVVVNGFMYKCSPECLRPVPEDEVAFRQVAQEYCSGRLPDELEQMTPARGGPAGRFFVASLRRRFSVRR